MLRTLLITCIGAAGLMPARAHAGKVDEIIAAVKAECGREITNEEAVRAVKAVYVTCAPGGTADLEGGCRIKCMKQAGGGVLGK